jgi:hypothetical protein
VTSRKCAGENSSSFFPSMPLQSAARLYLDTFSVWGLVFREGFKVQGLGCRTATRLYLNTFSSGGFGLRVQGLGCWVEGEKRFESF